MLTENDFIAFFDQFPITEVFKSLLHVKEDSMISSAETIYPLLSVVL